MSSDRPIGLRERKKLQTREAIWQAAIELFVARGYEEVSIAEIAAAANVSKMTVFNYFPTKEDLAFAPLDEHVDDAAQVVATRPAGTPAVRAVRDDFLRRLAEFDPSTGLSDAPGVLGLHDMVMGTPSLLPRLRAFAFHSEDALIEVLTRETDPLTARLAATQMMAVRGLLMIDNHALITAGRTAVEAHPDAERAALRAFELLEHGLGGL